MSKTKNCLNKWAKVVVNNIEYVLNWYYYASIYWCYVSCILKSILNSARLNRPQNLEVSKKKNKLKNLMGNERHRTISTTSTNSHSSCPSIPSAVDSIFSNKKIHEARINNESSPSKFKPLVSCLYWFDMSLMLSVCL